MILNGLKVTERTQFCYRNCYRSSKGHNSKIYIQELWFLRSARRLRLVNISMTIHEDILNGFQVTERTALYSVLGIAVFVQRGITQNYISKSYGFCDLHIV